MSNSFIDDFIIELFTDKDLCDKIKISIRFKPRFTKREAINKLSYLQNRSRDIFGIKIEIGQVKGWVKEERLKIKKRHIIDKRIKDKL